MNLPGCLKRVARVAAVSAAIGAAALGGHLLAQSAPARREPRAARPPLTADVLDRYLAGDYGAGIRDRPGLASFDMSAAERWIAAGRGAVRGRRQLAAAVYALEYSAARPHQITRLVPWARGLFSASAGASPIERTWIRASIALGEGLDLWSFLQPANGGHLAFARQRLPGDPYVQLAEAVGEEVRASRAGGVQRAKPVVPLAFDRIAAEVRDADGGAAAERREALDRAAALLEPLTTSPAVGAEAELRLGFVRLRQGRRDEALRHFDRIYELTADTRLRYLAHLYSGWALADAGRPGEAAIAYRAALAVQPRGQSAAALLVALLVRNEDLDGAEAAADAFLEASGSPRDPWQFYFLGDAERYGTFITELRAALR